MTEKRFIIDVFGDFRDENNKLWSVEKVCDEYNKLVRENEQLKSDLDYFQRTYEIEERGLDIVAPMCTIGSPTPSRLELFKENEQLKKSYKEFEDDCQSTFNAINRKIDDLSRKNFKLKEENEQLKKDLVEVHEICAYYEGRIKELQGDAE